MLRLFSIVLALVTLPLISACNSIPFLQKADQAVISAVQKYCGEPPASRQLLRQSVNQGLNGAAVVCVQCKGDVPDPACAPPK